MPVKLEQLPNEPIVIQTMSPDYRLTDELPQDHPKLYAFLDGLSEPVFWIVDISKVRDINMEDLLKGTRLVATGEKPLYHHPNMRQALYVSTKDLIKLAATGLGHDQFGNLNVKVFDSLDAALAYARERI
jgi:hypothetical protein